eukprot:jgi/Hompol1/1811/HPOL_001618-RA
MLLKPNHVQLLVSQGIMTEAEIKSRYHIMLEKYVKDLVIEGNTLRNMIFNGVLPAVFAYRKDLADSLVAQKSLGIDVSGHPEKAILDKLTTESTELHREAQKLSDLINKINSSDEHVQVDLASVQLTSIMAQVRAISDSIEDLTCDKYWPFPKYAELLF